MTKTLAWLLIALAASARGDTLLGESCDLAALGVADKDGFLRFDRELRAALAKQDSTSLSLLVNYPLRLNYPDGSVILLDNPAALARQFAAVFGPALRKIVAEQPVGSLFCKSDGGVMYGNGEVWVGTFGAGKAQRFRITSVNVPAGTSAPQPAAAPRVALACETDKRRIRIELDAQAQPRYRVWNKPHALTDTADLQLTGTADREGTGSCAHAIWRFINADYTYEISEPGCAPAPAHAVAQVQVMHKGTKSSASWCY